VKAYKVEKFVVTTTGPFELTHGHGPLVAGHSTVTVKLQVTRLLQVSLAVQFTVVVVPGAKELPESGLQVTVRVPLVQQLSVAIGV
jgi:hypothetical protein